ncbi:amphi-Trp domain-containing protein [Actinomarinicola tropica]|uniref:Amphi-Trp domain-containing protein n=1 Tax=Actinomarinicola tropica TaxID=2789776 RepID=A0A5Q2RIH7_9ACTN|nr:amphi-Trp domain-containing protein [Actinomarinicola tropica]QGG96589.1 amphi-Trp domain-containing protein [Actinomarinicola tropica]
MDLIEHEHDEHMRREAAADKLREIADMLSRHNEIRFVQGGLATTVKVPDEVEFSLEVEIGSDGNEIEIEISW